MRLLLGIVAIIVIGGGVLRYMTSSPIDKEDGIVFPEYFYNNGGLREDEDFIRQHITDNAYEWLVENFNYDCYDNDCLDSCYCTRFPGADFGDWLELLSINKMSRNEFRVSIQHERGIYYVNLELKKVGRVIKIDELKDMDFQSNRE